MQNGEYLTIAQSYMPLFHQRGEKFFTALAACSVPLQIMELAYDRLVRQKIIPSSLEHLLQEDQEFLRQKAKEYAAGRPGVSLKRIVKSIILVDYFLNLEIN